MSNSINLSDALDIITEKLNNEGKVIFTPRGSSMKPILNGEESVVIEKISRKLKKNDLPFIHIKNTNFFMIHRVIKVEKNGFYITCGDNMITKEYNISDNDVLGIVTGYYKNGKLKTFNSFDYKIYCFYINLIRPLRTFYHRFKNFIKNRGWTFEKNW